MEVGQSLIKSKTNGKSYITLNFSVKIALEELMFSIVTKNL